MDFSIKGARYTLDYSGHGMWTVEVPWAVATDGLLRETGRATSEQGELRRWMNTHRQALSTAVLARYGFADAEWDDPRIVATKIP